MNPTHKLEVLDRDKILNKDKPYTYKQKVLTNYEHGIVEGYNQSNKEHRQISLEINVEALVKIMFEDNQTHLYGAGRGVDWNTALLYEKNGDKTAETWRDRARFIASRSSWLKLVKG